MGMNETGDSHEKQEGPTKPQRNAPHGLVLDVTSSVCGSRGLRADMRCSVICCHFRRASSVDDQG